MTAEENKVSALVVRFGGQSDAQCPMRRIEAIHDVVSTISSQLTPKLFDVVVVA